MRILRARLADFRPSRCSFFTVSGFGRLQIVHQSLPAQGEIVWIRQTRWRVERARRLRAVVRLDVSNRHRHRTFLAPFDRWAAQPSSRRPRVVRRRRALALIAGHVACQVSVRTPSTPVAADIEILPFQLEPALAIAAGARRILIADEVGLGKTIQAGLAIAELVHLDPSARVLVVAPAGLSDQWRTELARRFQVASTIAGAEALSRAARVGARGDNSWRRPGVWIASPDYLKQPHVLALLLLDPWDLVAIDEAHGVSGPSERHRACDELTRLSRRVILMSATPHNGDETAFTRLLNLGRLDGIDDPLEAFRRTRGEVGLDNVRRIRWRRLLPAAAERRVFDALLGFEQAVLRAAGSRRHEAALLLLSVLRKRAFSTMAALVSSVDRRLAWLDAPERTAQEPDWLQPRLAFDEPSDDIGDAEAEALRADIGLSAGHERSWLRRVLVLARAAERQDSKIAHLARIVGRSREPVVIFTEFRHSLGVVRRAIEPTRRVTVLHGGLGTTDRQRALGEFLSGNSTALVATDVAGQGLNLQSASRWLINLELPWNPARLEQRVGRVDRIGQRRSVHITMLVSAHEAESGVLARLARRALSAKRALGAGVFDLAMPAEALLRAAILTGANLDDNADGAVPSQGPGAAISRRWERPARFLARQLTRRRRLASRWKGPFIQSVRPAWTAGAGVGGAGVGGPGAPRLVSESLLVFSASIVDRSGGAVERRPIAVRVAGDLTPLRRSRLLDALRHAVAQRLSARIRRLNRLLKDRRRREEARDRAIDEVLRVAARTSQLQPGLFHRAPDPVVGGRQSPRGAENLEDVSIGVVTLAVVMTDRS
jgi:superfamily II DNA or RNA helicase